jgi:hypothetical protein
MLMRAMILDREIGFKAEVVKVVKRDATKENAASAGRRSGVRGTERARAAAR